MRLFKVATLLAAVAAVVAVSPATYAAASTTYEAQTGNNTSACVAGSPASPADCTGTFAGQTDTVTPGVETPVFDPQAGNVSTRSIHSLLYQRSTTRVFVNMMQGFCTPGSGSPVPRCNNNVVSSYTSDSTATVDAQLRDIAQRGIDGVVADWYGGGSSVDATTLRFQSEIRNQGYCPAGPQRCQVMYMIMYDGGTLKFPVAATGINGTTGAACPTSAVAADAESCIVARLKNDMCYMNGLHFGNDAYQKWQGRPIVQFFVDERNEYPSLPVTGPAPSWADVWSWARQWSNDLPVSCGAAPYNANNGSPLLLFENEGGFTHAQSDGAFDWVNPTNNQDALQIGPAGTEGTVANFYSTSLGFASSKLVWGVAYKGFNDTQSAWGSNRLVDQRCGQTWQQTMAMAGSYYSSANQLPFVQVATWNDYNEGTVLETGIDNCYRLSASVQGSALDWSLSPTSASASTSTISGLLVYDSTDGTNFSQVASLPPGATSFDLSGLSPGAHTLFVQMSGIAGVLNQSSAQVPFTH